MKNIQHILSQIDLYGYASSIAGSDLGTTDGPLAFYSFIEQKYGLSGQFKYDLIPENQNLKHDKLALIVNTLAQLEKKIALSAKRKRPFVMIGGDHSSAIGTWSAVANATSEPFSLIWIDAHMDAHTMETSPSKNIHGTPVAHLLGASSDPIRTISKRYPALKPQNFYIIGVRSFEEEEAFLLNQLGVTIYLIDEVQKRGFKSIFDEVVADAQRKTKKIGLSVDIDAFDCHQMPGTGLHVAGGLCVNEVIEAIDFIAMHDFIGLEITEYNPHKDIEFKTVKKMSTLFEKFLFSYQVDEEELVAG